MFCTEVVGLAMHKTVAKNQEFSWLVTLPYQSGILQPLRRE